jgi:hypothetical protein
MGWFSSDRTIGNMPRKSGTCLMTDTPKEGDDGGRNE